MDGNATDAKISERFNNIRAAFAMLSRILSAPPLFEDSKPEAELYMEMYGVLDNFYSNHRDRMRELLSMDFLRADTITLQDIAFAGAIKFEVAYNCIAALRGCVLDYQCDMTINEKVAYDRFISNLGDLMDTNDVFDNFIPTLHRPYVIVPEFPADELATAEALFVIARKKKADWVRMNDLRKN